jgi:trimeric autotransporter adhesin
MAMLRTMLHSLRPLACTAIALAVAAPLSAQTSSSLVPSRIVQPVDDSARVALHGYIHPLASAANDRGAAPDSMPLERLHLVLTRSSAQEAALESLIAGMHTPGNANYHKWLTPAQFGQQFGPSDQDVATVESWLSAHGFEVTGVKPGKQVIEFNGSVAQLRTAFGAQIHKYVVSGNTHYATATEPSIPAALAPVVGGFVALNDFHAKSNARVLGQATYDTKTHQSKPEWTYAQSTYVVSPADFGMEYDLPNANLNSKYSGTTYDGAGQSIAIINDSNINLNLVQSFRTLFLPAYSATNLPTVIIDGNDPGVDGINNPDGPNYDSSEAYIDVEWSGAIAPKASVDLVIAADTALESGLFLAAEHAVYGDVAPVVSLSFGSCEASLGSTNAFLEQMWEQAAAQGQTVMVSAGDSGSAGCDSDSQAYAVDGYAVSGFASTPYNVAMGGTDFYYTDYATGGASAASYWNTTSTQNPEVSLLQYVPEQPWNDSQYGLDTLNYYNTYGTTTIGGGSGGASSAAICPNDNYDSTTGACDSLPSGYPKPSWQTGTGVPSDNVRDIPDVSLFSSDGSNFSFYPFCWEDADCQAPSGNNLIQISGAGGTSFAAPSFAGIMALVNEEYGAQGQADFVLYPLSAQYPAAFHRVTVGTNSVPCNESTVVFDDTEYPPLDCLAVSNPITAIDSTYGESVEGQIGIDGTPYYNASSSGGFSLATGLGSVDAAQLLSDWGKISFNATSVTMSPSQTSFTHGTAITISGSVTGTTTPTGDVALMTSSSEPVNQGQTFFTLSSGNYSGSVNFLPGGTYDIWGQYGGDSTNAASSSVSQKTQITVNPENSSIFFYLLNSASGTTGTTAATGTVPYGTQLILDAEAVPTTFYNTCNVSNPPSSCSTTTFSFPTGTIAFADNSTTINTAVINAEGDAEFNAPFSIGTHSVTASYSGDNSYNKSTSSTISFTVAQATPAILLSASNETAATSAAIQLVGGQATVFNVLVENASNAAIESEYGIGAVVPAATPTGSISVSGLPGGTQTATLSAAVDGSDYFGAGVGAITIPASAAAGTYTVTISYGGDTNYTSSTGTYSVTITAPSSSYLTSTTTATSSGSISATTNVTVSGTVTGQSGHPAPTGGVILFSSGNELGEVGLTAGSNAYTSNFAFTLNSQTLFQGANLVTLQYTGDTNYAPSAYTLNNTSPISNPLSDFSITTASTLVQLSGSATATTSVYVTPTNGFSGTVNLSVPSNCGVSGGGLTCSLSASSVSLTYSNTAKLERRPWNLLATGGGAVLACVLLFTIPARRKTWRNLLSLVLFACIAGFGIGCGSSGGGTTTCQINCGGGGGGGTGTGTATNATQTVTLTVTTSGATAGSYTVTVTGSASTSQIHTAGVIAQVQ